ncbi:MAG TPA: type II toxin-antitoxin system HicB family antitoxin [bacterium]|jgi:predicted RNase H-like HicB family nuclease
MTKLGYSLVIEATNDPNFFGFYSPDLKGLTGTGRSIADCIINAAMAMDEFVNILRQEGLPVPKKSVNATIIIENDDKVIRSAIAHIKKPRGLHVIPSQSGSWRIAREGDTKGLERDARNSTVSQHASRTASHPRHGQQVVHRNAATTGRQISGPHGRKRKTNNLSKKANRGKPA